MLVLPWSGPTRALSVLTIGVPMVLINAALAGPGRRSRSLAHLAAVSDIVFAGSLSFLFPAALPAIMMTLIGLSPVYVIWLGRRPTVLLNVVAVAMFATVGLISEPSYWVLDLIVFTAVLVLLTVAADSTLASITSNARLAHTLTDRLDIAVWESDAADPRRRFIGGPTDRLLGADTDGSDDHSGYEERIHPDDRLEVVAAMEALTGRTGYMGPEAFRPRVGDRPPSEHRAVLEYRIIDPEGRIRWVREEITATIDEGGVSALRGTITDETERFTRVSSVQRFGDFVTRVPTAIIVTEPDESIGSDDVHHRRSSDPDHPRHASGSTSLRVVAANPAAIEIFDGHVDDLTGTPLAALLPEDPELLEEIVGLISTDGDIDGRTLQLPMSESIYSVRAVALPRGNVGLMLDDITHIARTAELLRQQATHDHLTGLPNRAQFNDRLEEAIRACNSATDPTTVAVLMIDLNKFKQVNDTYGHEYGDKLLIEVARRLTRNIRGCDTISRLGGDEFAVVVRSTEIERAARDIAERIEQLIREPFKILDHTVNIGSSIGIAIRSQSLLSARTLVRDADHAMYRAKAQGGGIVNHDGRPTARGTTIGRG